MRSCELRATKNFVDGFLDATRISIDYVLDAGTWEQAAVRYARYAARRRASNAKTGGPKRFLADFIVGAHALSRADRLLTLDTNRYSRDFPDLKQWDAAKIRRA